MCYACAARGLSWGPSSYVEPAVEAGLAAPVPYRAATSGLGPTGNVAVDGLLDGSMWSGTISYSFPNASGDYESAYGSGEPTDGFGSVSVAQIQAARFILEGWSALPGGPRMALTPVEGFTAAVFYDAGRDGADIRIAQSNSAAPTAYAYLPGPVEGGDIWFGRKYDYTRPQVGDYAFATMLHELGHALGLKHGHEAGGIAGVALPAGRDSLEYSVMTYHSYVPSSGQSVPAGGYRNETFGFPQTYMMDDIAALQALYGANFGWRAGKTVYTWSPTTGETFVNGVGQGAPGAAAGGDENRVFLTIWDGGGSDTYDFSAYATKLSIDLAPGGSSSMAPSQRADLGDGHLARGSVFNALLHEGDTRSLIENATGGSAGDVIRGNAAKNVLRGNAGNDVLFGQTGSDTLYGGAGRDTFVFNTALDRWRNVDRLIDFSVPNDTIKLEDAIFAGITRKGTLASGFFHKGGAAHDPSDRIIYDRSSGALLYDADGTGRAAAVKFAQLKAGLALTAADFYVI